MRRTSRLATAVAALGMLSATFPLASRPAPTPAPAPAAVAAAVPASGEETEVGSAHHSAPAPRPVRPPPPPAVATGLADTAVTGGSAHPELPGLDGRHQRLPGRTAAAAEVPDERLRAVACRDGAAGPFPCRGVDLLSFVPAAEFLGPEVSAFPGISDLWGWTDPSNRDEYVVVGKSNGVSFFRVTDPTNPVYLGDLPNTGVVQTHWHDIKVYRDHAFIVSESAPHGMRVFDLTRLRGVTEPQVWTEDARYLLSVSAHNVAINTETGFAYIVGGNAGILVSDECSGGLHIVDIRTPLSPTFAGCWAGDGYIHDTQCVVYRGPDRRFRGRELCFNSAEETVTIVDVTDKDNPERLAGILYPKTGYTHQGWLTEDQRYFVFGDELDELDHGLNTRTLFVDVTDLLRPRLLGQYLATTKSIDHNLYIHRGLVYQSNYSAGLRVLDTAEIARGRLTERAFFDTFPDHDAPEFVGTWSNYPYFASGTVAVSGIGEGLFLLRLQR